jgi:hypothetical protein
MSTPGENDKVTEEWRDLLNTYDSLMQSTSGCGERGQFFLDQHFNKIQQFIKDHPEFTQYKEKIKRRMVEKYMNLGLSVR